MAKIMFPYRVKVNGKYYEPGTAITVADAKKYVESGAVLLEQTGSASEKSAQRKTAKMRAAK